FDERHHRGVRPDPGEPETSAPREAGGAGKQERQSDAEPDHSDLGPHFPDGAGAVPVRRGSAARLFAGPGDWYYYWDVFVDLRGQSDRGVLAGSQRFAKEA